MFIPYYTGQVIDSIAIEKDSEKFYRSIIIMALLLFVTAICSGLRGGIFSLVLSRLYIRVNKLLFGSILRQEIGFFDKTRTGDIVSRLTSDTSKMGEQVTVKIILCVKIIKIYSVCVNVQYFMEIDCSDFDKYTSGGRHLGCLRKIFSKAFRESSEFYCENQ